MRRVTIIAVLAAVWCTTLANVRFVSAEEQKTIRIIGTMLPYEEGKRDDLAVATIFVHDKPWFFRVGKVEGLSQEERDRAVNDGALMEQMRFYGPDALMRRMQRADVTGKPLTIEGHLNTKERRFQVTAIEEAQK
jgi:hypothetical protein